jgi:uncharacterized protein (TIGR00299 family) protein
MRVLYFDCFSGISGDMTVGALVDLGAKPSALEWELSKLEIGDFHMHFERTVRRNISAVRFSIHEGATHRHEQDAPVDEQCHEHEHSHPHERSHSHEHEHHHAHESHGACHEGGEHSHGRTYAEIRQLIETSTLSPFVKQRAGSIFRRLAESEGKIHGVAPDAVTFHEVGALDSIADVICACAGIEALGVEKVYVSPLVEGRGWIDSAHGRFPVPAPATLELLTGIPLTLIDEPFELITPTGAAILAEFGESFGTMPAFRPLQIGYGAGSRDSGTRPNVLRAVFGELEIPDAEEWENDTICRVETNLDDLSPEITGATMEKLFAAGALDVFLTPIQMKKNRPGTQLTVLCEPEDATRLAGIILRETTSFGVRVDRLERLKLERQFEVVQTPYGGIQVKLGLKGDEVIQIAPEFDSCLAASERSGTPLRTVYEAARAAFSQR